MKAPRAGALALTLLAAPLNVEILRALDDGVEALADLRREAGSPPQTSMRGSLRRLAEAGAIERHEQHGFPGPVRYTLPTAGRRLMAVADVVAGWLASGPTATYELGSAASKSVLKALLEGWSSAIVRAIAARPLSLTDLNRVISALNYPSIERRLTSLRLANLIEAQASSGRGTPYAPTDWLRRAAAPLTAAIAWERETLTNQAPPLARIDVEAGFLLALPLLTLPADVAGTCRLTIEVPSANGRRPAGVLLTADGGRVERCVARLQGEASGWAAGNPSAWLAAVIDGNPRRLEVGGRSHLPAAVIQALHRELFTTRPETAPSH